MKLPGRAEFALVAIFNAIGYSNGDNEFEFSRHVTMFVTSPKDPIYQRVSSIKKLAIIMH